MNKIQIVLVCDQEVIASWIHPWHINAHNCLGTHTGKVMKHCFWKSSRIMSKSLLSLIVITQIGKYTSVLDCSPQSIGRVKNELTNVKNCFLCLKKSHGLNLNEQVFPCFQVRCIQKVKIADFRLFLEVQVSIFLHCSSILLF